MKNLFTSFLAMTCCAVGFSQNVPIDFETGGNGDTWTWTVFENDTDPALEIIPNPDPSIVNNSCTVAKFTALQTGNPWAGCESQHATDLGTYMLSSVNSTITIMVWKPVISDVGIKLVNPTNGAMPELKIPNTLINQWEEITFDFSAYITEPIYVAGVDQIVIFPDFDLGGRTQDNICYFDHVYGSGVAIVPCCAATSSSITPPDACISYTATSGAVYTTSGFYADTIANVAGCDSMISIDIVINEVDISTTELSGTITSGATGTSTYQWLDCGDSYSIIATETNQAYAATGDGDYAVEVTTNGCVDTSACVNINSLGIFDYENASTQVHPNPSTGLFTIAADAAIGNIEVYSVTGQLVYTRVANEKITEIDLTSLKDGLYVLRTEANGTVTNTRIEKK
jgi:hypothetical protein